MIAHTPGPWNSRAGSSPHYQGQISSEATGETIAITYSDESGGNATLIAAAPDLLAALGGLLSAIGSAIDENELDSRIDNCDAALKARAAIAKALGQA